MMSTDDMVNWTYHGNIPVGKIAPWIMNSWAPSIVKRVEDDGKTHFYLYFSNSGFGTGVITATSPVGPWTSPLDKSLVDANTEGLGDCRVPFDPPPEYLASIQKHLSQSQTLPQAQAQPATAKELLKRRFSK